MRPDQLKRVRRQLGLTQAQLAERLQTTRTTVARYECGARAIPGVVDVAVAQLAACPTIPLAGLVAAGDPIEAIPQTEVVEVPSSMLRGGEVFALRVKGESMRDEGILPGDIVVVQKQETARNGQTVVAFINGEATIKRLYRKKTRIELHPAHPAMAPIMVTPTDDFRIAGVVVGVIRHCLP